MKHFVQICVIASILILCLSGSVLCDTWYNTDSYHSYSEICQFMADMQRYYGRTCLLYHAKDSNGNEYITEGRDPGNNGQPIHVLEISKNADNSQISASNDPNKVDIVITGGHHAREWIGIEVTMRLAQRLLSHRYDKDLILDPAIYTSRGKMTFRQLLENSEITLIPIVNPDGFYWSYSHSWDESPTSYRWWRKNRHNINGHTGVDINRNYNYQWGLLINDPRNSTDPEDPTYIGPYAASEVETKAVCRVVMNRHPKAYIDYHSYSDLVMWPPGYMAQAGNEKWLRPKQGLDAQVHEEICTRMTQIIGKNGGTYTPEISSRLYLTCGTSTDWAYYSCGNTGDHPASVCVEMGPEIPSSRLHSFQPPVMTTFSQNRDAGLWYLCWAVDGGDNKKPAATAAN